MAGDSDILHITRGLHKTTTCSRPSSQQSFPMGFNVFGGVGRREVGMLYTVKQKARSLLIKQEEVQCHRQNVDIQTSVISCREGKLLCLIICPFTLPAGPDGREASSPGTHLLVLFCPELRNGSFSPTVEVFFIFSEPCSVQFLGPHC